MQSLRSRTLFAFTGMIANKDCNKERLQQEDTMKKSARLTALFLAALIGFASAAEPVMATVISSVGNFSAASPITSEIVALMSVW